MKTESQKIANNLADMIIEKKISIREAAREVGKSKTWVHHMLSKYTTGVIRKMKLKKQLDYNLKTCHTKGGQSTAKKYREKHKKIS